MKKSNSLMRFVSDLKKQKNDTNQEPQEFINILNENTPFGVREAYKTARTNIIFSLSGINKNGCKVIAVTSAAPGEGKTTSTLNMAITFAQTDAKVLVIDGDLRKPRLHRYLSLRKDIGLTSVLSKQETVDKVIIRDVRPGLDVLVSGELPPNPAELLSSEPMREMLESLSENYDYIFIDTPPVTVVTDAVALSPFVDGMIVIVRQNYTDHDNLSDAVNVLNVTNTKILGFFVNESVTARGGYGYNPYNKYSYKHVYKYEYVDNNIFGQTKKFK